MDCNEEVNKIVVEHSGIDITDLRDDCKLIELGLNSLLIMRILATLETTVGFESSGEDVEQVMTGTLGDLKRIAIQGAGQASI